MKQNNEQTIIIMRNRTKRLDREGDYWSDDEREQLQAMFSEGIGISEIAVRLQRTEPAIFQQIEKMDLYDRKNNRLRSPRTPKPSSCLCGICQLDSAACPRVCTCPAVLEDA